jgi:hypothetical protein
MNPRQVEFLRSGSLVLVSRVLGVFLILFGIAVTLGRVCSASTPTGTYGSRSAHSPPPPR